VTPVKGLFCYSPIAGVISFGTATSSRRMMLGSFPWHHSKKLVVHSRNVEIVR
jgi:hypothetical protein